MRAIFGGKRKGKRGRGAAGKVAVFGLLKRGGRVYTAIIPDSKSSTLMPIIAKVVYGLSDMLPNFLAWLWLILSYLLLFVVSRLSYKMVEIPSRDDIRNFFRK